MDRDINQTETPFSQKTETKDNGDQTASNTSLDTLNGLVGTWTKIDIFRISSFSLLAFLTLVGNAILIIMIVTSAELRQKRHRVFILNLAVADLLLCIVLITSEALFVASGQLGTVACKLVVYGKMITMASSTFMLSALCIDCYQVRVIL